MDRDQRLREIRERVDGMEAGHCVNVRAILREDVPWLLAEVERLSDEQRRADELEGIAEDARVKIDRYKELSGIVQGERTEEQQTELWTLAQEMRHWDEAEGLRGQLKRVQAELDETKQVLSAQSKILATQAKELADWEHRWKTAQRNEIARGADLERRLGEMGYFPPDPSGQGYVSAMAHCELALLAVLELEKYRDWRNLINEIDEAHNAEVSRLRERLGILECHDGDTRGRLRPLVGKKGDRLIMDDLHEPDGESERTVPRWFTEWLADVEGYPPKKGAFDYPGSRIDD